MPTPEEKAKELGVPLVPRLPEEIKRRRIEPEPNPTIAVCGECGLEIKRVMHYSCPRVDCPVFAKVTSSL